MTLRGEKIHVVAAVILRDGRYLVCRRPPEKRHGGLWEFPGGKVDLGETHGEAIRRELAEELSLEVVHVGAVIASSSDEGSAFLIDFVETVAEGTPLLHEHSELGWFTPAELVGLPLAPADAIFASALVTKRS